jgi:hypothetical protein
MSDRDKLVEIASREVTGVILFSGIQTKADIAAVADIIAVRILDVVGPLIRTDERRQTLAIMDKIFDLNRRTLRTKVEALTHDGLTPLQSQVVLKREVLALLDGETDDQTKSGGSSNDQ